MNFVDKHFFSSELQAELYSDLQSIGGSNQLGNTCLEEERTAVRFIFCFISSLRLLKMEVLTVEAK